MTDPTFNETLLRAFGILPPTQPPYEATLGGLARILGPEDFQELKAALEARSTQTRGYCAEIAKTMVQFGIPVQGIIDHGIDTTVGFIGTSGEMSPHAAAECLSVIVAIRSFM